MNNIKVNYRVADVGTTHTHSKVYAVLYTSLERFVTKVFVKLILYNLQPVILH